MKRRSRSASSSAPPGPTARRRKWITRFIEASGIPSPSVLVLLLHCARNRRGEYNFSPDPGRRAKAGGPPVPGPTGDRRAAYPMSKRRRPGSAVIIPGRGTLLPLAPGWLLGGLLASGAAEPAGRPASRAEQHTPREEHEQPPTAPEGRLRRRVRAGPRAGSRKGRRRFRRLGRLLVGGRAGRAGRRGRGRRRRLGFLRRVVVLRGPLLGLGAADVVAQLLGVERQPGRQVRHQVGPPQEEQGQAGVEDRV